MTTVVPVKGISGKIYRFVMVSRSTDLPEFPGVYTFAFPIRYPGAPLESVCLGRAPHELRIDVLQSDLRAAAIEQGATMIRESSGSLPGKSRSPIHLSTARKRHWVWQRTADLVWSGGKRSLEKTSRRIGLADRGRGRVHGGAVGR
jgi:hypothetical protein